MDGSDVSTLVGERGAMEYLNSIIVNNHRKHGTVIRIENNVMSSLL